MADPAILVRFEYPAPLSHFLARPLFRPLYNIVGPVFSPSLLSATTQQQQHLQQHSLVTDAHGAAVCMCVPFGMYV